MTPSSISLWLVVFSVAGSHALNIRDKDEIVQTVAPAPSSELDLDLIQDDGSMDPAMKRKIVLAKKLQDTLKSVKQFGGGGGGTGNSTGGGNPIEMAVRTNFLYTLYSMANASAIAGQNVSRSAAILIRGFIQDSFNLVSISAYFPRLIFLDGPTQFIETLRLIRAGQLRIPQDMDSAIDTLINFATQARNSQIAHNLGTPVLSFFPNVFRGAELLASEVVFNVFGWLAPISPVDINIPSVEGLWNRWDTKSSTTDRSDYDKEWQSKRNNNTANQANQAGCHFGLLNNWDC